MSWQTISHSNSMKTYLKRPDPKRAEEIERLLQGWVMPSHAAAATGIEISTVYRYAEFLNYRRVWLRADEIELVAKHRASKQMPTTP